MVRNKAPHKRSWKNFRYFFPFQLSVLHVKKNHFLLLLWVLLFGFALGAFAPRFGVPQQFLVPEYQGKINFLSFAIVGFATGGFITGFNLYTYIMHGYRFPFIATLSRPFHKFSLNNFVIPSIFVLTYCFCSADFQYESEYFSTGKIIQNLLGFIGGIITFQLMSYFYFMMTNKDAKAFGTGRRFVESEKAPVSAPLHHKMRWLRFRREAAKWHVETYMSNIHQVSRARESQHYDKDVLEKVFSQNHINAARFELVLVISFLVIGNLRFNELFIIPAAASVLLFFTMMLMLLSALHSWIKGWTLTLFILLLVSLNFFYKEFKWISSESRAIGLNYEVEKTKYQPQYLRTSPDTIQSDIENTISILEAWKKKTGEEKPAMVIIDCSGGGSRSAFWTMRSLMKANAVCDNKLLNHTILFTGASGGMFGAATLREMMLLATQGKCEIDDSTYAERMALDLLNPVILSLATNDWFFKFQSIRDGEFEYTEDRATAFERQFNLNTQFLLDKRLEDYTAPEKNATIPMMVLSPTIVNDGRRMLISAQPVGYLTHQASNYSLPEDVEFTRFMKAHDPYNLKWVTALRINATFPYIFPMTTLPTTPSIELMDAGVRDNFGMKTTAQFLHTFNKWIKNNTSEVVILQVRDLPKYLDLGEKESSLFGKVMAPIGSIYGNMTKGQDYNNDQILEYLRAGYGHTIKLVSFELAQTAESQVSLSWHLSQKEKQHIRNAVDDNFYKLQLEELRKAILKN
ncbi:MAG: hypothetical protein ACK4WD_14940 [Flavobacteriales bacterium]|jgi:hypothetical protein